MAAERPTLLDIVRANGTDAAVGLIDEAAQENPEIGVIDARTIKGVNYPTLIRTANPTVAFRNANEGTEAKKSTYERRLVEVFIMNPRWEVDKAVADAHEDGAEAYIAMEGAAMVNAAIARLCGTLYYGRNATFGDAKGFPGLLAAVTAALTVDAGGTTDSTCSSVWMVRAGPRDVKWVVGLDGEVAMPEPREETIRDAAGLPLDGYVQSMLVRPGLQVASRFSVGRIHKLTADLGKGLTDALLAELFAAFPTGHKPNQIFMSRRSLGQLQASRTATNATGVPAPTPGDWEGLPIHPTDSIVNIETLTL